MIILPNTCKEDWNSMTAAEKGRHCGKCSKIVTDFTSMSTEEVLNVLRSKKKAGESICGRFHSRHLTPISIFKPEPIVRRRASRMQIFLAALVLVFSSSLFTSCSEPQHKNGQYLNVQNVQAHAAKRERGFSLEYTLPSYWIPQIASLLPIENPEPEIYMVQGIEPYYEPVDTTSL